jgi:glycosyltransferase involved in cell wall biosynthesis
MNKPYYPKILIVSETFKSNTGGGITLSNLFRGYPKECLANAIDGAFINTIESSEICNNFYSLGVKERKIKKPFHLLFAKHSSGKYIFSKADKKPTVKTNSIIQKTKRALWRFFNFLGLNHILIQYQISEEFERWVCDFSPDYIYTQLSSREQILFAKKLIYLTGAQLAIHIMDDWPITISNSGVLRNYWKKKIDNEFKYLISIADVRMSISEGMSDEYLRRYGKDFFPFHNPIEIEKWLQNSKKTVEIDLNNINILYAGRIGLGTSESIIDIANAIGDLIKEGYNITFQVQTTTKNSEIIENLLKRSYVQINPTIPYSDIPKVFSSVDILVLPIDFSSKGINFLKYSMPTKVTEFMISGTPILLFCDQQVSLFDHATKYGWAYTVSERSNDLLKKALIELLEDSNIRKKISKTALDFAISNYNASVVRYNFQNKFITLKKNVYQ